MGSALARGARTHGARLRVAPRTRANLREGRAHARPRRGSRLRHGSRHRLPAEAVRGRDPTRAAHRCRLGRCDRGDGGGSAFQRGASRRADANRDRRDVCVGGRELVSGEDLGLDDRVQLPGLGEPLQARRSDALRSRRGIRPRSVSAVRAARPVERSSARGVVGGTRGRARCSARERRVGRARERERRGLRRAARSPALARAVVRAPAQARSSTRAAGNACRLERRAVPERAARADDQRCSRSSAPARASRGAGGCRSVRR